MTGPAVLVLALDEPDRRQLLLALAQRQRRLRDDGAALPHGLFALAKVLGGVSEGQGGSPFDLLTGDVDDRPMLAPLTVTFATAAASLGVSQSTLKRLVRSGDLLTVKVGARRLVRTADLASYVASLSPSQPQAFSDPPATHRPVVEGAMEPGAVEPQEALEQVDELKVRIAEGVTDGR